MTAETALAREALAAAGAGLARQARRVIDEMDANPAPDRIEQLKQIDLAAKALRDIALAMTASDRAIASLDALTKSRAPRAAADKPDSEPSESLDMNVEPDPDWTPERLADLRAEIDRRLAAYGVVVETKSASGPAAGNLGPGLGLPDAGAASGLAA